MAKSYMRRKKKVKYSRIPKRLAARIDEYTEYTQKRAKEYINPFRVTGDLEESIKKEVLKENERRVYTDSDYANIIEFKYHPFMRPAKKDLQKYVRREYRKHLKEAVEESSG